MCINCEKDNARVGFRRNPHKVKIFSWGHYKKAPKRADREFKRSRFGMAGWLIMEKKFQCDSCWQKDMPEDLNCRGCFYNFSDNDEHFGFQLAYLRTPNIFWAGTAFMVQAERLEDAKKSAGSRSMHVVHWSDKSGWTSIGKKI